MAAGLAMLAKEGLDLFESLESIWCFSGWSGGSRNLLLRPEESICPRTLSRVFVLFSVGTG